MERRSQADAKAHVSSDPSTAIPVSAPGSDDMSGRILDETGRVMSHDNPPAKAGSTGETVDALRRSAKASADAVRLAVEDSQDARDRARAALTGQAAAAATPPERTTQQGGRVMDVAITCGMLAAEGYRNAWSAWMTVSNDSLRSRMDLLSRLTNARSASDLMQAQGELFQAETIRMLEAGRRLSQIAMQITSEAAERFRLEMDSRDAAGPVEGARAAAYPSGDAA